MLNPIRPGDYLIFAHRGFVESYPTNGAPLGELAEWMSGVADWAVVWAPSRSAAKRAAETNWASIIQL